MKPFRSLLLAMSILVIGNHCALAAGRYYEITYQPSQNTNELVLGVTYTIWIPEGVKTLRGVIVHQHGCGESTAKGAVTAAYDLHWQALALKWDCALVGPSYHLGAKDSCRLWCDPRNGSDRTFLRALAEIGQQSNHPELDKVPWALWGHSGGGFWSSLMLTLHPERIAAIWFRSGSAFGAWERGEIRKPMLTDAMFQVPVMFNGGVKEASDPLHGPARVADRAMFKVWREHGAPAGFAPDPQTGHDCGDSRYLAIPFLDTCLALRLPPKGSKSQQLRPVDFKSAWYSDLAGETARPAKAYSGDPTLVGWLPNEKFVTPWREYVKTGATGDTTPPPSPKNVKSVRKGDAVEITWDAPMDFESGLQAFMIIRDGKEIGRWPAKPTSKYGRPLFQVMSSQDTPVKPLPEMRFIDPAGGAGSYAVVAVNSVGLRSAPSAKSKVK